MVSPAFAGEDAALGGGEIVEGTDGDLSSVVGLAFGGGDWAVSFALGTSLAGPDPPLALSCLLDLSVLPNSAVAFADPSIEEDASPACPCTGLHVALSRFAGGGPAESPRRSGCDLFANDPGRVWLLCFPTGLCDGGPSPDRA